MKESLPDKEWYVPSSAFVELKIPDSGNIIFCGGSDKKWMMKLINEKGVRKIHFNTEEFPKMAANDFAKEVMDIMHRSTILDDLIKQEAKAMIKKLGKQIND